MNEDTKLNPELKKIATIEGPQAQKRFTNAMRKILAVPREEILRREAEYKKQSLLNPNRRGPKPKAKKRKS